jgi:hypothetical protein
MDFGESVLSAKASKAAERDMCCMLRCAAAVRAGSMRQFCTIGLSAAEAWVSAGVLGSTSGANGYCAICTSAAS